MTFTAVLRLHGKNATGIEVPASYVDELAGGKRPAVLVTLNSLYTYRCTVMPYEGQALLPVAAEHREAAGVNAGESLTVTLSLDTQPRTVEVPEDLAEALGRAQGAREAFEGLAPSHKKAHVESVLSAKTPETRTRRVAKVVEALASKSG